MVYPLFLFAMTRVASVPAFVVIYHSPFGLILARFHILFSNPCVPELSPREKKRAFFLSIFFRAYTVNLPKTDDWAEDSVHNYFKSQIRSEVDKQYPNLPSENKDKLVDEQTYQKFKTLLRQTRYQMDRYLDSLSDLARQGKWKSRFKRGYKFAQNVLVII